MSEKLNNPEVLKRLCDNIAHTISTLHIAGLIPRYVHRLLIDVKDNNKHHFSVHWGEHPEELTMDNPTILVIEGFTIRIVGINDNQSLLVAGVVGEIILSSLNMATVNVPLLDFSTWYENRR